MEVSSEIISFKEDAIKNQETRIKEMQKKIEKLSKEKLDSKQDIKEMMKKLTTEKIQ